MQFVYKEWTEGRGVAYAWWECMHTRIDIVLCGNPEEKLREVFATIEKELCRIEKSGSYYDTSGELYRINKQAALAPVEVSSELYGIIEACTGYNRQTLGYFDISVQSEKDVQPALPLVKLYPEKSSVFFEKEGVKLDLSGYLKGYALERIREILAENSVTDALVNMGNSSVLALGDHPHGKGWKVQYNENFERSNREILLLNECLTTSGNETAGRRHIVNPVTGSLVRGKGGLSVVTRTGTDGEVLSTALFAAGIEEREKIAANFPEARIE